MKRYLFENGTDNSLDGLDVGGEEDCVDVGVGYDYFLVVVISILIEFFAAGAILTLIAPLTY